jgi:hypothetical protein
MKKWKTYQEFLEFIEQGKFIGATYSSIRQEAIDQGFKGWLFDYYNWKYSNRYNKKDTMKKVLKYIFYIFVYFGCFCFTWDLYYMIKSTTIRNETETLALVIDSCYKAPKLCKYAVITGDLKLTRIDDEPKKKDK